MKISISGFPGSGKTSVIRSLNKDLGYKVYSAGSYFRNLASSVEMSVNEFTKNAEKDEKIDLEIDDYIKSLNSISENMIIDSRLAWKFIPDSIKIYLDVDPLKAAERKFIESRGDELYTSIQGAYNNLINRHKSEVERYKKLYDIDLDDKSNYDLIIDTTFKTIEEVKIEIINNVNKRLEM